MDTLLTGSARSAAYGVWAALRAPLWLAGPRLRALMAASPERGRAADAALALRAGSRALRLLSRVPASPWRDTCLFRSVTECLVLRGHGVDARLRIGVRGATTAGHAVEHHAWVWRSDVDAANDALDGEYLPLSNPGWLPVSGVRSFRVGGGRGEP